MKKVDGRKRLRVAVKLKASTIRRLIRQGKTVGQIADKFRCTRMTLYRRYGKQFKGLASKGNRAK